MPCWAMLCYAVPCHALAQDSSSISSVYGSRCSTMHCTPRGLKPFSRADIPACRPTCIAIVHRSCHCPLPCSRPELIEHLPRVGLDLLFKIASFMALSPEVGQRYQHAGRAASQMCTDRTIALCHAPPTGHLEHPLPLWE